MTFNFIAIFRLKRREHFSDHFVRYGTHDTHNDFNNLREATEPVETNLESGLVLEVELESQVHPINANDLLAALNTAPVMEGKNMAFGEQLKHQQKRLHDWFE